MVLTLFFFMRNSRPLTCLAMMAFLRLEKIGPVDFRFYYVVNAEFRGVLKVVPDFGAKKKGLGGDAATCRQVPPSLSVRSMRATLRPSCPARMAAV